MRSRWVSVKAGDVLLAEEHMNKLGRKAFSPIPNSPSLQAPQYPVIITNLQINDDDEEDSGLYLCKVAYHNTNDDDSDRTNDGWAWDNNELVLDARWANVSFVVNDHCTAFWSNQRGAFLPSDTGPDCLYGVFTEALYYNDVSDGEYTANGRTFSVYARDSSNQWLATSKLVENVLPPTELKAGCIPSYMTCWIQRVGPHWTPSVFPKRHWAVLTSDLVANGSATGTVGDTVFEDIRGPSYHSGTILTGATVGIALFGDGYWYVTHASC